MYQTKICATLKQSGLNMQFWSFKEQKLASGYF